MKSTFGWIKNLISTPKMNNEDGSNHKIKNDPIKHYTNKEELI